MNQEQRDAVWTRIRMRQTYGYAQLDADIESMLAEIDNAWAAQERSIHMAATAQREVISLRNEREEDAVRLQLQRTANSRLRSVLAALIHEVETVLHETAPWMARDVKQTPLEQALQYAKRQL